MAELLDLSRNGLSAKEAWVDHELKSSKGLQFAGALQARIWPHSRLQSALGPTPCSYLPLAPFNVSVSNLLLQY